jgi:hypothetical protein
MEFRDQHNLNPAVHIVLWTQKMKESKAYESSAA